MNKQRYISFVLLIIIQLFIPYVSWGNAVKQSILMNEKTLVDLNHTLLRSIMKGDHAAVEHALKQGATANASSQNRYQRSALIIAAAGGYTDIVALLLANGAAPEYRDNAGLSALTWSVMRGKTEVTTYLLSRHVNANTRDDRGLTPAMYAVGTRNMTVLKALSENGASLDVKSKETKMTALLIAVENGDHDGVLTLLKLGANVNTPNFDGYTPLMSASESGHIEILNTLLRYGADIGAVDANGMTALALAKKNNVAQIEAALMPLDKNNVSM